MAAEGEGGLVVGRAPDAAVVAEEAEDADGGATGKEAEEDDLQVGGLVGALAAGAVVEVHVVVAVTVEQHERPLLERPQREVQPVRHGVKVLLAQAGHRRPEANNPTLVGGGGGEYGPGRGVVTVD